MPTSTDPLPYPTYGAGDDTVPGTNSPTTTVSQIHQ
jgi:hypothetical protein